jgi:uncharacterized membrane protein
VELFLAYATLLTPILIAVVGCAVAGYLMLARVDRGFAGVLLGFFLGPVGLIIAWVMRANALRDQDERERRDRPTRHEDSRPLTAQLDELVSRRARGEITDDEYQRRKHELF